MVLRAVAAAFVVLVSQGPTIRPQTVDFSGSWTLVEDGSGKLGALGTSVKVTQTPTTLTIEHLKGATETYTLNGETRKTFPPPGDRITSSNPERMMWMYAKTSVSVSGWLSDQLVIVTHQFNRVNVPGATPREFDSEFTYQLKLALDASGRLEVERDMINDPLPEPTRISPAMLESSQSYQKKSVYVKATRP